VTKEGEKRNGRKKEEEALDFRVMTQGGGEAWTERSSGYLNGYI